ncbi:MAG: MOSC N-terminal beta barrel domain-containing protein [bacterium]
MTGLHVAGLWRYPVKSLAGEPLIEATLTLNGIPGDRGVYVRGPEGVRTARVQYRMLGLHGTLDANGRALIDGLPWTDARSFAAVREAAGRDAELAEYPGLFDILPLLVATDGAVAAFGRDVRRLRPNILIGGVDGMQERGWEGRALRIGDAIIRLDSLRARCPITSVDPDTLVRDMQVLRDIGRRFRGQLALNAEVLRPGLIRVGDRVQIEKPSTALRDHSQLIPAADA